MDSPGTFDGTGDASAWLQAFEERAKKKSPSWKTKRIAKLVVGDASSWHYDVCTDHWDIIREKFVAYWVDGLRGEAYKAKCKSIDSKAPVEVNWVTMEPPEPPKPKPEPSSSHPIFSVLVNTGILDPRGVYDKAFAQFTQAVDKEKMFRVIWDAAFETGHKVGISAGRGQVRSEAIEEGRQLGMAIARQDAEKRKEMNYHSISVDTSDLNPSHTPSYVSLSTQTDVETSPSPGVTEDKLNWAEESDAIPPAVLIPPTPKAPPRDFSALRTSTSTSHPFGSLQQRVYRFHRSHRHYPPRKTRKNLFTSSTVPKSSPSVFTRSHPSGIGQGKPTHTSWTPRTAPESEHGCRPPSDWVLDPRLVRLGQVLLDLGWIGH